jgi:hypothetical protein
MSAQQTIMTAFFCKGYTQHNVCCTNSVASDGICKMHCKKSYDECSICLDDMHVKEKLGCGHTFCKNCIYKWKGTTCPLCRSEMFFINHNKDILLENIEIHIKKIDEKIDMGTIDEDSLHKTIQLLVENMWIHSYDKSYIEILSEYVSCGLRLNPKCFKKQHKIFQATVLRLSNNIN